MTSPKKGRKKRKPSNRDDDNEEFFKNFFGEDFFKELERMAEEIFRMLAEGNIHNRAFTGGFRLTVDENGKPKFERIGGKSLIETPGGPSSIDEREPYVDMIEGDEEIAVTVEIPNVRKEDIDLRITEDKLEIKVKGRLREKYHKTLELPCKVDPDTAKATYRNGILDVIIRRRNGRERDIHHVSIE